MPISPDEIRKNTHVDSEIVAEMVIYVEPSTVKPGHLYNCKNLSANGDCSAYATRPAMCREFPYDGNQCPFEGCTRKAIEMEEHPTPWSMKLEGGEYVIRNANGGEVSRHKKKAEALTAFDAGKGEGEVVQIPPADAPVADPPPPELPTPRAAIVSEGGPRSQLQDFDKVLTEEDRRDTPPPEVKTDKPRRRGSRRK